LREKEREREREREREKLYVCLFYFYFIFTFFIRVNFHRRLVPDYINEPTLLPRSLVMHAWVAGTRI